MHAAAAAAAASLTARSLRHLPRGVVFARFTGPAPLPRPTRCTASMGDQPGSAIPASVMDGPVEGREALVDFATYSARWQGMWADGIEPNQKFDGGGPSPALLDLLPRLGVEGQRAFVPGCGRGYDLVALAQVDATRVVGLELAETAAAAARAYLAGALAPELQARVEMVQGDFFAFQYPDGPADLGYDYTFCCALHPTMLEHWAQTWARHIRPGGRLVALIFPVDPTRTTGPPWAVTTDQYKALLEPQGFVLESMDKVPEEMSHKGRGGMEYMSVWRRA